MINQFRLLIADDDSMVRSIVIEHLTHAGFRHFLEASNGLEALKYIRNMRLPLDLVISDWEMPGVDGLTVLKALRSQPGREDVKFMMLTSQVSRERHKVARARESHADAYMIKPFRGEILKEKVIALLTGAAEFAPLAKKGSA
ncbi:MAG: response regulator [Bdellovibrionales bacterium]|nr:response regulator [Bdellovibrionales bacterium]